MIARLILAALLIGIAAASAQNMSQMGMAPYANPPAIKMVRPAAPDGSGPHGLSDNPMILRGECPYGYGPTHSGSPHPNCLTPNDYK